jgi:hypothetical protein
MQKNVPINMDARLPTHSLELPTIKGNDMLVITVHSKAWSQSYGTVQMTSF